MKLVRDIFPAGTSCQLLHGRRLPAPTSRPHPLLVEPLGAGDENDATSSRAGPSGVVARRITPKSDVDGGGGPSSLPRRANLTARQADACATPFRSRMASSTFAWRTTLMHQRCPTPPANGPARMVRHFRPGQRVFPCSRPTAPSRVAAPLLEFTDTYRPSGREQLRPSALRSFFQRFPGCGEDRDLAPCSLCRRSFPEPVDPADDPRSARCADRNRVLPLAVGARGVSASA